MLLLSQGLDGRHPFGRRSRQPIGEVLLDFGEVLQTRLLHDFFDHIAFATLHTPEGKRSLHTRPAQLSIGTEPIGIRSICHLPEHDLCLKWLIPEVPHGDDFTRLF